MINSVRDDWAINVVGNSLWTQIDKRDDTLRYVPVRQDGYRSSLAFVRIMEKIMIFSSAISLSIPTLGPEKYST